MKIKEIHEKAGPLQDYVWFLALTFAWYLLDNLYTSIEPIPPDNILGQVLGLGYITVIAPFLIAGLIGGIHERQKMVGDSSLDGFIKGVKNNYWRFIMANVISMVLVYAVVIIVVLAGGPELTDAENSKLFDYINIPFSAITLFWFVAVVVEQKIFKGLIQSFKTLLFNPFALAIGIIWGLVRFADTAVVDSLNGQVSYLLDGIRAIVLATVRVLVTVYALAIYKQVHGEAPNAPPEETDMLGSPAASSSDGLVNASFGLAFVSFVPLVHIVALVLGIISLKRKERFILRSAVACCVGGFFTIFYLLVLAGWIVTASFPAMATSGYNFLVEANADLEPQVRLLEQGSYEEIQQQLESNYANTPEHDWSVDCILALAKFQNNDVDGAMESFLSAIEKKPDRSEFYYYYGVALIENDEADLATKQFQTALRHSPKLEAAERYLNLINATYTPSVLFSSLLSVVILIILFALHEYGHAYAAWKLGDDTAKNLGRLTLNPAAHLDPFGSIILPAILLWQQSGVVFGWAKPVPVDPRNFQNPRRDHMRVSFAGPAVNLIISMVCLVAMGSIMLLVRLLWPDTLSLNLSDPYASVSIVGPPFARWVLFIIIFLKQMFYTSLVLGCFNLLPVPPLDGSWILSGLLPQSASDFFEKIRRFSFVIFLLLVATPVVDYFLMVPMSLAWGALQILFSAMGLG